MRHGLVSAIGVVSCASLAMAVDPPIRLEPAPPKELNPNPPVEISPGVWSYENISYGAEALTFPVDVIVDEPISIGTFSFNNGAFGSQAIQFNFSRTVDPVTLEPRIQSIGILKSNFPGNQEMWVRDLAVEGNVGAIYNIHDLVDVNIGGSIGTEVEVGGVDVDLAIGLVPSTLAPFGPGVGGNIFNVDIGGNVLGEVYAAGSPSAVVSPGLARGQINNMIVNGFMSHSMEARESIENVTIKQGFSGDQIATGIIADGGGPFELGISGLTIGDGSVGNLEGIINTNLITGTVDIRGSINNGGIVVRDKIGVGGELLIGGFVRRDLSLVSGISVPTDGLEGRIVLERNAMTGLNPDVAFVPVVQGGMTEPTAIAVGPQISITTADHEVASVDLGGGTIGVAPWPVLDLESDPVGIQVGDNTFSPLSVVETAFYGPVTVDTNQGAPVTVTRRIYTGQVTGDSESAGTFTATVKSGTDGKVIEVTGTNGSEFEWGYQYTIDAGPGLMCADTTNSPVPSGEHVFTIGFGPCPTDLDPSLETDSNDLSQLLAQWGNPGGPADFDDDGIVDSFDLSVLLAAWGPCGVPQQGAAMAGPGGPGMHSTSGSLGSESDFVASNAVASGGGNPVLEHFGFSSVSDYTAWLAALNQAGLDEHLAELIQFVQTLED